MRQGRNSKAMLVIMVCAAMTGVYGCVYGCFFSGPENLSSQEREAVDWIRGLGGKIEIDYVPWTGWIAPYVVDLAGTKVRDEELHNLEKLAPKLCSLDLSKTRIDGSGMPSLADISKSGSSLSLWLHGTKVTDDTLGRFIKGLDVGELDLSDTCITDDGIKYLITADIGRLDLSGTQVTIAGIRRLKDIDDLLELRLRRLPLLDDDIPALIELAEKEYKLRVLDLRDTGLSGVGRLRIKLSPVTKIIFESGERD